MCYPHVFSISMIFKLFIFIQLNMGNLSPMKKIVNLFKLEQEIHKAKFQGQYNLALSLFNQVIAIKQELPNKLGLAKTIAEKGFLLEQCGYQQDALRTYNIAANIAQGSPNLHFLQTIDQRIKILKSS